MEDLGTLDVNSGEQLKISSEATVFLTETAKWGQFLGVLGFIGSGLMALGGIFMIGFGGSVMGGPFGGSLAAGPIGFGVVYILISLIPFFGALYLFNFSSKMKRGIKGMNQIEVDASFKNLRNLLRLYGIIAIVYLSFVVLAILIGFIGALAG